MRDELVVMGAEVPSGRAIAQKLRMERYSCKPLSSRATPAEVAAEAPAGVILAGAVSEGAAPPDAALLALGIPVLALGSSAGALCAALGSRTEGAAVENAVVPVTYKECPLFDQVGAGERWVERAEPYALPEPYRVVADGEGCPLAYANSEANAYLLQFRLERNDPDGMAMLVAFADTVCGCTPRWTAESIIAEAERALAAAAAGREALCAMSGGLDSTVAAILARRALGDRVRCVFVDTGLMREGEAREIERYFRDELSFDFERVDISTRLLCALGGLTDMEDKRRVIEREIDGALRAQAERTPGKKVIVKGTNYADVLEGVPEGEADANVLEPLRDLFKAEVRMLGEALSLSPAVVGRQPFPGMGLAARIQGEITAGRLKTLRRADMIFTQALTEAGLDKRLSHFFALLHPIDGEDAVVLRATQGAETALSAARLPYDLLERACARIHRELPDISKVLYDITADAPKKFAAKTPAGPGA